MQKFKAFFIGLALAISVGVLAQDSVIPSRMKLQALRVGAGTIPSAGNATVTGTLTAATASVTGTATVGTLTATSGTVGGSNICTAANGLCTTAFSGAKIRQTSTQFVANNTDATLTMGTEVFDVGNWYTSGTSIVIPSGVAYAECDAQVWISDASATTGVFTATISLNGESISANHGIIGEQSITYATIMGYRTQISTGPMPVTAGQAFSVRVLQSSGGSVGFVGGFEWSNWLACKRLG